MKAFNDRNYLEKQTWGDCLDEWKMMYTERIAIVEGEHEITYSAFHTRVNQLASGFKATGIKKGQCIVVQLPNRASFIYTCFALFKLGAIPVLVRPAHREADLIHIFEKCEPVAYIIADKYLGFKYENMAKSIFEKYDFLEHVFVDGETENFTSLRNVSGEDFKFDSPQYSDMALITLSGGTTGNPKLIPRTHGDYIYNVKMATQRTEMEQETVFLAALPISHGFAFANPGILGTFISGGKVVLCPSASPDEVLPLIEEHDVTLISLVPAAAQLCLETLAWDDSYDLSSLDAVLVGGSVLEESLARRLMDVMECKVQQVFGMSEGLICMTRMDDAKDIMATCQGKPISEYDEIKIVDESFNQVPEGEFGELVTRGPYTIHGYYKAPEANKESFTPDGYYRTGDRAQITKEGNVFVIGRMKDRINRGGEKIMPSEVEAYLLRHDAIRECVVVGIPNDVLGESILAYVVTDNEELNLTQIHEFLIKEGVSSYKFPDKLSQIEAWPLTSVGKIDKNVLKSMAV